MFSRNEIIDILKDDKQNEWLFSYADNVRKEYVGNEVHLRGLIEFSNICKLCKYGGYKVIITAIFYNKIFLKL